MRLCFIESLSYGVTEKLIDRMRSGRSRMGTNQKLGIGMQQGSPEKRVVYHTTEGTHGYLI